MFDIGFWELTLIGVVALLVIGPDRLPGVARTTGIWIGKARRFVSSVQADVEREIRADELKRIMKEQAEDSGIPEMIEETRSGVRKTQEEFHSARKAFEADKPQNDSAKPSENPANSPKPPE